MIFGHSTFKDNSKDFLTRQTKATDMALAFMAQDIEIIIKTGGKTPFRKGKLRGDTYHAKQRTGVYRVIVPVEYAEVQEKGYRGNSKQFTNYTTAGTGAHFFRDAVNTVKEKAPQYIKDAKRAAGIR